jgi:hypothetical protein
MIMMCHTLHSALCWILLHYSKCPLLLVSPSLCSPPPLLLPPTSSSSASLHNHLHLTPPTILCCSNFKELVWIEYSFLSTLIPPILLLFAHCIMYYFYICIQLCCIQWSAVPPVLSWAGILGNSALPTLLSSCSPV